MIQKVKQTHRVNGNEMEEKNEAKQILISNRIIEFKVIISPIVIIAITISLWFIAFGNSVVTSVTLLVNTDLNSQFTLFAQNVVPRKKPVMSLLMYLFLAKKKKRLTQAVFLGGYIIFTSHQILSH